MGGLTFYKIIFQFEGDSLLHVQGRWFISLLLSLKKLKIHLKIICFLSH